MEAIISIHAPSRERQQAHSGRAWRYHFNPRSLAGATLRGRNPSKEIVYFNPRSLAGATEFARLVKHVSKISIHAPSRERP